MSSSNPLSSSALLSLLLQLLPSSTPLPSPTTSIFLLSHAIHTSLGFRQVKPAPYPALEGDAPQPTDPVERNRLDPAWLARNAEEESFSVSYRHEQSSLLFEVRTARLGGRIVVNAVAVEDNKTATLDITLSDYLSPSNFPKTLDRELSLESLFNSPSRFSDFVSLYKIQIVRRLLPGLHKPGYTEEESSSSASSSSAPPPSSGRDGQRQPYPDDPPPGRIGAGPQFPQPGRNPLEIGRSDLDPLGGTLGRLPGAGGDGMVVGPGHPLFNREREQNDPLRIPGTGGRGNPTGPWGGDGYLPPLGAPPGARFDPVGPFGGNAAGVPRRDWGDEFQPPGFDNENGSGLDPLNPGRGGGFGGFGGPSGPRGGFGRGGGGPPAFGGGGGGFGGGGFGSMFG